MKQDTYITILAVASSVTNILLGIALYNSKTQFETQYPIKDAHEVCVYGVSYEVLSDQNTGMKFLNVNTDDDYNLLLCK